jgi:endoglucanase
MSRVLVAIALLSLSPPFASTTGIKVDQAGYLIDAPKVAIVASETATAFAVVDSEGSVALRGSLGTVAEDPDSGDRVRAADFSSVRRAGSYRIVVDGVGESWPFKIADDAYRRAYYLAMRSYYGQRCGTAVDLGREFPGYAHGACHRDAAFHASSGKTGPHMAVTS